MKECSYCGMICKDTATVCKACGTPLSAMTAQSPDANRSSAEKPKQGQEFMKKTKTASSCLDACDAIEYLKKATVHIFTLGMTRNNEIEGGSGTGFFIRYQGKLYLITNHHVIESAIGGGVVSVQFPKEVSPRQDAFSAEILVADKMNDVALLGLILPIPEHVCFLELADISDLRAGEKVVTVGCPRHMAFNSVEGSVSNTCFTENPFAMSQILCTLLTTNGNSGGAVIRLQDGAVIGLVTAGFKGDYLPGHTICSSADAIRQLIHAYERGI